MKFFTAIILTALLSFAASLFFPWWIIAVSAFIVALVIHQNAFPSFVAGFLALFLLWAIQSYLIDAENKQLLSGKVASIFPLGGSGNALILVTGLVGGFVAGMAAMTASFTRKGKNRD